MPNGFEDYGDVFARLGWLPVVGAWAERGKQLASIVGKILKAKKQGVAQHRLKIESALKALSKPVIAVLDDIDRLSRTEIRDVFKLVRLTAKFPNIIYMVAFDRARVERALSDEDLSGRDYLEKILQVTMDLPPISQELLARQTLDSIEEALTGISKTGPFNSQLWPDVFAEIVRPLIRTPRDVRRYAVAVRSTVLTLMAKSSSPMCLGLRPSRPFCRTCFRDFMVPSRA